MVVLVLVVVVVVVVVAVLVLVLVAVAASFASRLAYTKCGFPRSREAGGVDWPSWGRLSRKGSQLGDQKGKDFTPED